MSRSDGRLPVDRHVRRMSVALAAAAVLVSALGAVGESMWALGAGAWLLIAAILLDPVYRP
ncbi:hypothetical protein ACFC0D_01575 [Streptomyces sp. NPDC056222]|uniref:hypothetical protein n=1 Tax=Streptomyces sp. NPDC056222 TaxID=3345749 RepID=UPI0035D99C3E